MPVGWPGLVTEPSQQLLRLDQGVARRSGLGQARRIVSSGLEAARWTLEFGPGSADADDYQGERSDDANHFRSLHDAKRP